jgi:hypothetical protein
MPRLNRRVETAKFFTDPTSEINLDSPSAFFSPPAGFGVTGSIASNLIFGVRRMNFHLTNFDTDNGIVSGNVRAGQFETALGAQFCMRAAARYPTLHQ